jgi:hypothetical protein
VIGLASAHVTSGEKAVAIFTRGGRFTLNADGTGVTGNWKLNPARSIDSQGSLVVGRRVSSRSGSQTLAYCSCTARSVPLQNAGKSTANPPILHRGRDKSQASGESAVSDNPLHAGHCLRSAAA